MIRFVCTYVCVCDKSKVCICVQMKVSYRFRAMIL